MRRQLTAFAIGLSATGAFLIAQKPSHFNPTIDLLAAGKPVFGLYAPANPRGGGGGRAGGGAAGGGATLSTVTVLNPPATAGTTPPTPVSTPMPTTPPVALKTQAELAKDAIAATKSDFTFNGGMEGSLDGRGGGAPGAPTPYTTFVEYAQGLLAGGWLIDKPYKHMSMPTAVKTPEIAADPAKAIENISRQLNAGVSTIVFVGVESAKEVQQGLAAMRFKSKGGTRPDAVGDAPKLWGMSEKEYKEKADVWPLNPNGELVNWTIIESKEGLAHLEEIAAVKGIGSLVVGWGTLNGVFRGDPEGRENAAQQVLAACKKYKLACGFPAGEGDIEMRMKQGFSLFIIGWGEAGQRAIDIGRKVAGR